MPIPPPVASFSLDVTSGTAPVNVQFSDTSKGPATTWEWDFGDGLSSKEQNPSHEYTKAGSPSVQFTATGPGGSHTVVLSEPITVRPGPLADLVVSHGAVSLQVQETAQLIATGLDQFSNEITDVQLTWTASAPLGSIDETGLLTAGTEAGAQQGLVKVSATQGGQSREASVDVTITPGSLSTVTVKPSETTLDIGAIESFIVAAFDEFGNEITEVVSLWSTTSEAGTINTMGYLPPERRLVNSRSA